MIQEPIHFNHRASKEARKLARLDASFKKDAERWIDGYINHSSSALRQKVVKELAASNGH